MATVIRKKYSETPFGTPKTPETASFIRERNYTIPTFKGERGDNRMENVDSKEGYPREKGKKQRGRRDIFNA